MTVSDNTVVAEFLRNFFENLGKKGLTVLEKMAKSVIKDTGRDLQIGEIFGTVFASRSPEADLSSITRGHQLLSHRKMIVFRKLCSNFYPNN